MFYTSQYCKKGLTLRRKLKYRPVFYVFRETRPFTLGFKLLLQVNLLIGIRPHTIGMQVTVNSQ